MTGRETLEPTIRAAGSAAVLLDLGNLDAALRAFALLVQARDRGELVVDDLVPAAATVLVAGGEARDARALAAKLRRLLAGDGAGADSGVGDPSSAGTVADASPATVIPVHYTGEDLAEVAALTGMSQQAVIDRHVAAEYTVAFTGFAPGFAYLSGGDPLLEVPRRATPRPRIQPGSVGLAGPFSGVYPRESPGGWQIIGLTEHKMWDLTREHPAALVAGGTVRFEVARESVVGSGRSAPPEAPTAELAPAEMPDQSVSVLRVLDAGLQSLIEDGGRHGASGMGVGESGTAIRGAYREANRLVGNEPGAAAIELSHGGFALEAIAATVLAITGAERANQITGPFGSRRAPHAVPFRLSAGELVTLQAPARGLRTIVGVRGGIDAPPVLGSRSRDTLAGLGPEPLEVGNELAVVGTRSPVEEPGAASGLGDPAPLPVSGETTELRVVFGPRDDWFDPQALAAFTDERWEVTPRSDRVGVRLAGRAVARASEYQGRELPSEGMVLGAIQVPPDGQPVLFLADRPLTGGYPVIAVVHDDDLELAAQLPPGSFVRFVRAVPAVTPVLAVPSIDATSIHRAQAHDNVQDADS
ncbi:carboxyltransferase domain-containing protein [Leucobacter sp. NPDC058333]|uniref:5-oxoprolinase subunit B/C family protein n=1 Tax=Leucobacter sp. NPDC058333 TaxID=3346450 RepID=UPI003668F553